MGAHRSATKSAALNFSLTGDNTVIAAAASGPINVYGMSFTVTAATNITFKDSVAGAFSGAYVLTGNGSSLTFPLQEEPWFQVQPGSGFVINQSGSATIGGMIWYTNG
jgi:hypothetical protein